MTRGMTCLFALPNLSKECYSTQHIERLICNPFSSSYNHQIVAQLYLHPNKHGCKQGYEDDTGPCLDQGCGVLSIAAITAIITVVSVTIISPVIAAAAATSSITAVLGHVQCEECAADGALETGHLSEGR